jgi:UDP-N-acetylglucosamine 2-epimerase
MILSVIGARPQFVKAAVLSNAFKKQGIVEEIIHTGQHYDYRMSEIFFEELGLPGLNINLNLGSGTHGKQTADMICGIEDIMLKNREKISHILLYGDTNSTLAGALAASKLNIPIIHVEAGLRSFNRSMPEEINRVVTDHLSSLLFCSSSEGEMQLEKEGITKGVHIVGDIMLDAFKIYGKIAKEKVRLNDILPENIIGNYNLLTIHRPSNTDLRDNLMEIFEAMRSLSTNVVWPIHPRMKSILKDINIPSNVILFEPFSYFEMMIVLAGANKVLTDSGGLQKEAYWAQKPCITIRNETEWVETLHNNWNILTGPDKRKIVEAVNTKVEPGSWKELYGQGNTADKIIQIIRANLS